MRAEIDESVAAGNSDDEIKDALIREYGHGILVNQEGYRKTLAYTVPITAVAIGVCAVVLWILRNHSKSRETADLES